MKKIFILFGILLIISSCEQSVEKISEEPSVSGKVIKSENVDIIANELKEKGYQTFTYKEGDTSYLMQQYYIVFLKSGDNRSQDSITSAKLQEQHLAHLGRMYNEGYTSLTGPMGDDGELRGIVIYNTPTQKEADSLARLDPMVMAGRLKVEVHPWWVAKGGKLN